MVSVPGHGFCSWDYSQAAIKFVLLTIVYQIHSCTLLQIYSESIIFSSLADEDIEEWCASYQFMLSAPKTPWSSHMQNEREEKKPHIPCFAIPITHKTWIISHYFITSLYHSPAHMACILILMAKIILHFQRKHPCLEILTNCTMLKFSPSFFFQGTQHPPMEEWTMGANTNNVNNQSVATQWGYFLKHYLLEIYLTVVQREQCFLV